MLDSEWERDVKAINNIRKIEDVACRVVFIAVAPLVGLLNMLYTSVTTALTRGRHSWCFWFVAWRPSISQCRVWFRIHKEIALDIPITAKEMSAASSRHLCRHHFVPLSQIDGQTALFSLFCQSEAPINITDHHRSHASWTLCLHSNINGQSFCVLSNHGVALKGPRWQGVCAP